MNTFTPNMEELVDLPVLVVMALLSRPVLLTFLKCIKLDTYYSDEMVKPESGQYPTINTKVKFY